MEFLAQIGMFLLQAIVIVISILVIVAGITAISKKDKDKVKIKPLNKKHIEMKEVLLKEVKSEKLKNKKPNKKEKKPSLFVVKFTGDIKASQVEELRQEITAILSIATEGDEVVVCIESPGGSVNGYGLAASQLQRIRDQNIPLTACIDKVAASGGYLMACVANSIVAAPFAIIGSIGVVAQFPNFHRWLKKNDIDVELLTAGEYKRTLTLFSENTEKGREKFKEDLEQIHQTFRNYVANNRNQLDIAKVSTGEHWLAKDAFELRLVDILKTSDDYIINKMDTHNCFEIEVPVKKNITNKLLKSATNLLDPWA